MAERKSWIWTYDVDGNQKSKEQVRDLCNVRVEIRPAVFYSDRSTKWLVLADVRYNKHKHVILAICEAEQEGTHVINNMFKSK